MDAIIDSILDSDTYKFSMQQAVLHQYPDATVWYTFKCRNEGVKLGFLADQVKEQVAAMADIALKESEQKYLLSLGFLKMEYLSALGYYKFNPDEVHISDVNGELVIEIEGLWRNTILWEVPILAIVNELYFLETTDARSLEGGGNQRLRDKMGLIRQYPTFRFAEFGTRRRYSRSWQEYVLKSMKTSLPQLVGTSNVKLAMETGLTPIGTMAHEYISAHLALAPIPEAQKRALHVWLQEYDESLGIALTDTFTNDAFYRDFDKVLTNAFAGVRHDSGNPIEFGRKTIDHYQKMGIDPKTKTIVFSDGLDVPKAIQIYKEFVGRIGVSFGIGTNLTNDLGAAPLNIVIKLIKCNDKNVVKLSDNPSKAIGNPDMVKEVKKAYVG